MISAGENDGALDAQKLTLASSGYAGAIDGFNGTLTAGIDIQQNVVNGLDALLQGA